MNRQTICKQLANKINSLILNGNDESPIPGVHLLYGTIPRERSPVMYESGIIFLFSGHKTGYLNGRVFHHIAIVYLLMVKVA